MSDELLVVRAQLGERAALAELVARWRVPVWTYVRRMLDAERADDVAQEVWLAVVRGLPRLREPGRFAPWLFTIARRSVTDRLRAEYAEYAVREAAEPEPPAAEDPVEAMADAVADRADLVDALAALPVPEREILVLFYLEDLPVEECAQICQIPAGTVKSRLNRARRLLREHLEERGHRS
ncbi:RNA polymerase sigma-70 factor (ECF subfamily) [Thermocatellispora tengchongensis]|uniref:RNA polymerase sigma-70 factor (ECF subfamily) n=1 Tax=Thermocatellispora tengchongensis TaxID=1073253 RepID=A0A840PFV3_9ACTN|nr:sigma-70 family RNA polymerase sigma factor [Thermocatellispora tengchongensis]MBB5140294.1 RNA polymerase sigma-70 factor (ECF subfamily) [Thermocatellispora tengchongensis]